LQANTISAIAKLFALPLLRGFGSERQLCRPVTLRSPTLTGLNSSSAAAVLADELQGDQKFVATSLLTGKFTGNIPNSLPVCSLRCWIYAVISVCYRDIPYSFKQGILFKEQGICNERTGDPKTRQRANLETSRTSKSQALRAGATGDQSRVKRIGYSQHTGDI
jgi:hypothetical protein